MVRQAHGGAIWQGTPATIVPGPGRPRDVIRQKALEALTEGPDVLTGIMRGETVTALREKCPKCGHEPEAAVALPQMVKPGEQVKAVEALAKLAGDEKSDLLVKLLVATRELTVKLLPKEQAEMLLAAFHAEHAKLVEAQG